MEFSKVQLLAPCCCYRSFHLAGVTNYSALRRHVCSQVPGALLSRVLGFQQRVSLHSSCRGCCLGDNAASAECRLTFLSQAPASQSNGGSIQCRLTLFSQVPLFWGDGGSAECRLILYTPKPTLFLLDKLHVSMERRWSLGISSSTPHAAI